MRCRLPPDTSGPEGNLSFPPQGGEVHLKALLAVRAGKFTPGLAAFINRAVKLLQKGQVSCKEIFNDAGINRTQGAQRGDYTSQ